MRFLLFVLLLLPGAFVDAGELHLVVNGKAYHFDRSKDWNENNWGAGFEYDFAPRGRWIPLLTGSSFLDSNEQTSNYLGGGAKYRAWGEMDRGWHADVGVVAFFMTRKDRNEGNPFFGALPFASVGTPGVAVNMTFIPKVTPKTSQLLYFQVMFRFARF